MSLKLCSEAKMCLQSGHLTSHALKVVSVLATTYASKPLLNFRWSPFLNFALPVHTNLLCSLFCDQKQDIGILPVVAGY